MRSIDIINGIVVSQQLRNYFKLCKKLLKYNKIVAINNKIYKMEELIIISSRKVLDEKNIKFLRNKLKHTATISLS